MKGIFNLVVAFAVVSLLPASLIVDKHSTVEAQSSIGLTSPEDLPLVELNQATPRQKEILSQMPESEYENIQTEAIRVAEVDLNNDGVAEYISTYIGQCGNRGCPTTIYSNQKGSWRQIYGVLGGSRIKLGNTVTNGFRDLLIPTSSKNRIHRVLTFTKNEYSHTHFQDGSNRFNEISRRAVRVTDSTVFYSSPSKISPVKPPFSVIQPIIVGRTNDWYLVLPCDAYACSGSYFYLPVEVVDGESSATNNQSQNTSFTTRPFSYDSVRNPVKNLSISHPSTYRFRMDGPSGGYEIWNRQPSRELHTSISGDYDKPRAVALPTGFAFTYFNAVSSDDDYVSVVNNYIKYIQTNRIQFRRENVQINGIEGGRFYFYESRASSLPFSLSCCGVITILRPNNSGRGYIRAISYTQDLKSDLETILTIHNSIRRL